MTMSYDLQRHFQRNNSRINSRRKIRIDSIDHVARHDARPVPRAGFSAQAQPAEVHREEDEQGQPGQRGLHGLPLQLPRGPQQQRGPQQHGPYPQGPQIEQKQHGLTQRDGPQRQHGRQQHGPQQPQPQPQQPQPQPQPQQPQPQQPQPQPQPQPQQPQPQGDEHRTAYSNSRKGRREHGSATATRAAQTARAARATNTAKGRTDRKGKRDLDMETKRQPRAVTTAMASWWPNRSGRCTPALWWGAWRGPGRWRSFRREGILKTMPTALQTLAKYKSYSHTEGSALNTSSCRHIKLSDTDIDSPTDSQLAGAGGLRPSFRNKKTVAGHARQPTTTRIDKGSLCNSRSHSHSMGHNSRNRTDHNSTGHSNMVRNSTDRSSTVHNNTGRSNKVHNNMERSSTVRNSRRGRSNRNNRNSHNRSSRNRSSRNRNSRNHNT
ncbi:hypothetical protein EVAR_15925_1 [Eumeta japonica]|uniref:Uncharacterized protein n=1 Tax=Eumeta variegata TaxID=151549 RepID=A0A4C1UME1_EUMVA|nr:hypothetical protein EVAR_15925_1 [Eumeta japonica]